MRKTCLRCKQTKPYSEFSRDRSRKDGHDNRCRKCKRAGKLHHRYGLTEAEWEEMFVAQAGLCAICCTELTEDTAMRTSTDHCHSSGRVRALLCGPCNTGLGHFRDSAEFLRRAAEYIDRFVPK